MPTKNKYFPVAKGREVGIFTDYDNGAKESADRFSKNKHKGCVSLEEALLFMSKEKIFEPDIIGDISDRVKEDMRRVGIFDNYDIDGNRARRRNPIAAASASLGPNPETEPNPETRGGGNQVAQVVGNPVTQVAGNLVVQVAGNLMVQVAEDPVAQVAGNPVAQVAGNLVVQVAEDPVAQAAQVAEDPVAQAAQVTEDPVAQAAQEIRDLLL